MSLPPQAQAKLIAIEGAAVDAKDASLAAQRHISVLQKSLNLTADPETYAGTEVEISRLRSVQAQANHRYGELAQLGTNIRRWLQQHPDVSFETARAVRVQPHENETIAVAIARTRDEIAAAKSHLHVIKAAPVPKSVLRHMADKYVKALAERGRPKINTDRGGLAFDFRVDLKSATPGCTADEISALFAWYDADKMLKRLVIEIDKLPEPQLALSAQEKEKRTAELSITLADLEAEEESLIVVAGTQGQEITRRPDASPLAVLGITFKRRAEAA